MNILLITPWNDNENGVFTDVPIGTAYINSALRNNGYNVVCMAFTGEKNPEEIVTNLITENNIRIVLCGGLSAQYRGIKRVFDLAKHVDPSIITIGGGGGFTAEPLLFTEMCGADFAVIGEGDYSTPELIDAIINKKDVSKLKGVVYKKDNEYCFTGSRAPIEDLDSIPFPSYEGFPIEKIMSFRTPITGLNKSYVDKPRVMPIVYSRSCPFKCSFCFHPTGDKYRSRSMDNFFEELDQYVEKYNINGIELFDECFKMDDSVFEFCRRIKKYNIKWFVSLVAKTVTPEKLRAMKDAGCCSVLYGVESMSETVLKDMHKPADIAVIERALKMTVEAGITAEGYLIFGAEAETAETVKETLYWWLTHREYQMLFGIVIPYPGSLYYDHCVQRGIIKDKRKYIEDGCPQVNMSKLSDHDFERLINLIYITADYRITWDYACHGEIIEEIANYEGDSNRISMKLKCFHCGKIHTYGNIPKYTTDKAFYMRCRSCGMISTYGNKGNFNYQVLNQWIKNETRGEKLSQWITDHGFSRVVIYGMGELGCSLYTYLKPMNIVVGVTDKNPNMRSYVHLHTGMELTLVEEITNLHADLILIAPSYEKKEIIDNIRKTGYEGRIETLFDIVFGLSDIIQN